MNDPKENQPWAFAGRNIDFGASYPETYSSETHINHQYKLGHEIKNSCQIICFVKDTPEQGYLNEIMWAHYADNHKGVCLEIDNEVFLDENKEVLTNFILESVTYGQHEKPSFGWDANLNKEQNIKKFAKEAYKLLFLRKSVYWERENEERLIVFSDVPKFLTIKKSLTGIYFGLQMPYSYRPSLDTLITEQQTKLFDLHYEDNKIKIVEREKGDHRQLITRSFYEDNKNGT
jgi:hypothetical protein